ncbi:hypothetical protein IEQ34_011502 [Dendrobium chrysotoxum]|uniref:NAC domain-containing protein n=1 Tax=Dendrobium chrysotoxum TaxID=161865 RepID=A0AAV7GSU4_DENCH|nr:hypothetical protein IEQ34_011502 [Dendrobium chrysotoxum]
MSILSMVEAKLPPGFRFHPRDDELICEYLSRRVSAAADGAEFYGFPAMVDVDLNRCEPWDLPETACVRGKEWYFFSLKDKKYATGQRTNRATVSGYWKATGKDRQVLRKGELVGMRKTLVFYQGRAPKGKKTEWVMHEFRMVSSRDAPKFSFKEDWVLCRVFFKSRPLSPKISTETCDEDTDSSSLPPLTDSHITSYNHVPLNLEGLEQVPCFSNFSASQATDPSLFSSSFNTVSCDHTRDIKAMLSQLSKIEENQQINGSCFSDSAIPTLWNPFASF